MYSSLRFQHVPTRSPGVNLHPAPVGQGSSSPIGLSTMQFKGESTQGGDSDLNSCGKTLPRKGTPFLKGKGFSKDSAPKMDQFDSYFSDGLLPPPTSGSFFAPNFCFSCWLLMVKRNFRP